MYISAVISEFNPFHLGHQYLIDSIRKNGTTHIVTVMSGNFVQRGEPAILSKWARTEIALNCGVDLVIEIPTVWSVATAEKYAYTGIKIIDALNCVDCVCFGSECGDIGELSKISRVLTEPTVFESVKNHLKQGITYAKARELAITETLGNDFASLLRHPNNILGIEYLKAMHSLGTNLSAYTVSRKGLSHNSTNVENSVENIINASMIRNYISNGEDFKRFVPSRCNEIVHREISLNQSPASLNYVERAVLAKLRCMEIDDIVNLPDISEGIENRIFDKIKISNSLHELYSNIKTKRYTMSRIRRIILCAFLGINKEIQSIEVPYIKVLGFNGRGKEILSVMKNRTKLPVVTNFSDVKKLDDNSINLFELESKMSDVYAMMSPCIQNCNLEKTKKIIVVK